MMYTYTHCRHVHDHASLRGKLFFLLSAAYAMLGRAATLPLVQRQYRDATHEFVAGTELHECLLFFRALDTARQTCQATVLEVKYK